MRDIREAGIGFLILEHTTSFDRVGTSTDHEVEVLPTDRIFLSAEYGKTRPNPNIKFRRVVLGCVRVLQFSSVKTSVARQVGTDRNQKN